MTDTDTAPATDDAPKPKPPAHLTLTITAKPDGSCVAKLGKDEVASGNAVIAVREGKAALIAAMTEHEYSLGF